MRTARISDLRRGHLRAEFVPKLPVESFHRNASEGCTIVTIERHNLDRFSTVPLYIAITFAAGAIHRCDESTRSGTSELSQTAIYGCRPPRSIFLPLRARLISRNNTTIESAAPHSAGKRKSIRINRNSAPGESLRRKAVFIIFISRPSFLWPSHWPLIFSNLTSPVDFPANPAQIQRVLDGSEPWRWGNRPARCGLANDRSPGARQTGLLGTHGRD